MPAPKEGFVGHEVEDEVKADVVVTPHDPLLVLSVHRGRRMGCVLTSRGIYAKS